ncbi:MAG: murein biosynthesis integral membrane protein MurJ [Bacillaceae bacterium]
MAFVTTFERKKMIVTTFFFTLGTGLGKLFGFGKEVMLGSYYGTSYVVDAYVISLNIPGVLISGMISALTVSFLPIFTELYKCKKDEAFSFLNHTITIVFLFLFIPLVLVECFPTFFISLFAPNIEIKTRLLAESLLQFLFPIVFFLFLIELLSAYLNSQHSFFATGYRWAVVNIITLLTFFALASTIGIYALILGVLLGNMVQLIFTIYEAKKFGYCYTFTLRLKNSPFTKLLQLSVPAFITTMAMQINLMVDRSFVSALQEGSIAALNYAQKLYLIPTGLLAAPILTIMYTQFVHLGTEKRWDQYSKLFHYHLKCLFFLFVPIGVYLLFYAKELITLVYDYGSFNEDSIEKTKIALQAYALAALLYPMKDLLDRSLFSLKENKKIMIVSLVSILVNFLLCVLLIPPFGLGGAAFATSLSTLFSALFLYQYIKKYVSVNTTNRFSFSYIGKVLFASIIALLITKGTTIELTKTWIIFGMIMGISSYIGVSLLLKIEELQLLLRAFKKEN